MREFINIPMLAPWARDAHKGDRGRICIIAGSLLMPGAAWLSGQAAARAGAGLVTIASASAAIPSLAAKVTIQTLRSLKSTRDGAISAAAVRPAAELARAFDALAIGPGLSADPGTIQFVKKLILQLERPFVLDADGLNAISSNCKILQKSRAPRILTPHPGEAARLLKTDIVNISERRVASAVRLATETGSVVLLKGAATVVTDGERVYINKTGNPGMATGGSGDVLTGILAALLGRGLEPMDAAVLGAHVHGRAGDLAARAIGEQGMIATDMLDTIPSALSERVRRGRV